MDNTLSQGYSLLIFLYGGMVLGAFWGVCERIRRQIRKAAIPVLCDLLFCAAFLTVTAVTFFLATAGVLRLYGALGMALGLHIERMTFGKIA